MMFCFCFFLNNVNKRLRIRMIMMLNFMNHSFCVCWREKSPWDGPLVTWLGLWCQPPAVPPPSRKTSCNGSGPFQISEPASLFCPLSAFSCINARFHIHGRRNLSRPAHLLLILFLESTCFWAITVLLMRGNSKKHFHNIFIQSKRLPPTSPCCLFYVERHIGNDSGNSEKITCSFVCSAPLFLKRKAA